MGGRAPRPHRVAGHSPPLWEFSPTWGREGKVHLPLVLYIDEEGSPSHHPISFASSLLLPTWGSQSLEPTPGLGISPPYAHRRASDPSPFSSAALVDWSPGDVVHTVRV